jgi:hypothetical protein
MCNEYIIWVYKVYILNQILNINLYKTLKNSQ